MMALIVVFDTSFETADFPILSVPSGHIQTTNLSTHWAFFTILLQSTITLLGSFLLGWVTTGFAPGVNDASLPKQLPSLLRTAKQRRSSKVLQLAAMALLRAHWHFDPTQP